jgi:anti-sigma factor RsiW
MDCATIRSRLHAYLDQELDLPGVVAIDEHLGACAQCRAAFSEQRALQSALRKHAARFAAPASLRARIRESVGGPAAAGARSPAATPERARPFRPLSHWLQLGGAVAATALATWVAALVHFAPAADEAIAEQVVSAHARSVVTAHVADVASSDQHTVKPWLSARLDYSPPVTDLTGAGFPLVGGRLDYLDNRPVAALVFRHRQHVIDLFVWPEASGAAARLHNASRRGFNVVHWSANGMAFWAVSDVNASDLKTFAETYASAQ